jgi:hypothetical protein
MTRALPFSSDFELQSMLEFVGTRHSLANADKICVNGTDEVLPNPLLNPSRCSADRGIDAFLHRSFTNLTWNAVRIEADHFGGSLEAVGQNLGVFGTRQIQVSKCDLRGAVGLGGGRGEGKKGGDGEDAKHGDLL